MITIAIILTFLLGVSVLIQVKNNFNFFEWIGFSLLLGMTFQTLIMFFADVVGLKLTSTLFLIINPIIILMLCALQFKRLHEIINHFKSFVPSFPKDIKITAIAILCVAGWLFYAITVKNLFWPATEHDTISSFDKLGRIIAKEGTLHISLYKTELMGAGGFYPPLWHGLFAYGYLYGIEMAKIFTTLMYAGMLFSFFGIIRRYIGDTIGMLATLLLMMVPEMYAHASMSLGNLPTTAYVTIAALPLFVFMDKKDHAYLWISALGTASCLWIRSDTVVFALAAGLVLLIYSIKEKDFKSLLLYVFIAGSTFILWNLYLKFNLKLTQADRFLSFSEVPEGRWGYIMDYMYAFFMGTSHQKIDGGSLYGISFTLSYLLIIVHLIWAFIKNKVALTSFWPFWIYYPVALVTFILLYYIIDEAAQRTAMVDMIESSFKRGVFYFIPIIIFYAFSNETISKACLRIEEYLSYK